MVRSLRRGATTALAAAVLLVPSLAAAQSRPSSPNSSASDSSTTNTNTTGTNTTGTNTTGTGRPTAPNASSTTARTLAQLQREARRLTLIARLPAADRQQAGKLLERADALRLRGSELRRQQLQAYIDALRAGAAPAEARAQAQHKIAAARTSLTQDEAVLRADVQAFLQKAPQARALLRYLDAGRGMRSQALGRGHTPAPAWGSQPGMDRGTRRPDTRRPDMFPGGNGRGMGWRQTGPGWNREGMPYGQAGPYGGPWGPGMGRGTMGRGRSHPDGNGPGQRPDMVPRQSAPQNGTPPATPPVSPPPGSGNGGT